MSSTKQLKLFIPTSKQTLPDSIRDASCGDPGAVLVPNIIDQKHEEEEAGPKKKSFDWQPDKFKLSIFI